MTTATRESDERILHMLDLRENEGFNGKQIMAATGMSKGAIAGAAMRVCNAHLPCKCRKKANKNGGMPRNWWRL